MSTFGYTLASFAYHEMAYHLMYQIVFMSAGAVIIALGLGSIVFFSTVFIVIALLIRNRWDDMGKSDDHPTSR